MGCSAGDGAGDPNDSSQIAESDDAIDTPGLETQTILAGCSTVVRTRLYGDTCFAIYSRYFSGSANTYNNYNPNRPCNSLATGDYYCSP